MASKLNPTDKQLLNAGNKIRIGNKPYENGIFGSNPNRDFVQVNVLNSDGGLLQSTKKPFSEIDLDSEEKLIIRPVQELNAAGINSGTYTLEYNFLKKKKFLQKNILKGDKNFN